MKLLRIFMDEHTFPIRQALEKMTDDWIDNGEYSAQTVFDLRDACKALLEKNAKAKNKVSHEIKAVDELSKRLLLYERHWNQAIRMNDKKAIVKWREKYCDTKDILNAVESKSK